jgi:hypothetical protein
MGQLWDQPDRQIFCAGATAADFTRCREQAR